MDISKLVRNKDTIHASLVQSGTALVTKTGCRIYIPTRYEEHKMAIISNELRICCVMVMVVGEHYSVSLANAMMQITPTSTSIVNINGDDYYEFTFAKGAQITPNVNLVKDDSLVYNIYDEIVAKGHYPWFLSYEDVGKLFTSSTYHGNLTLGPNNVPLELLAAAVARSSKDRTLYYRHTVNGMEGQFTTPPVFIALKNVMYGATNTTAKLMGAYFDEGLLSAFANPSEHAEGVETLLRK